MTHDDVDDGDENDLSFLNGKSMAELAQILLDNMANGRRELRKEMRGIHGSLHQEIRDMRRELSARIDGVERRIDIVELKVDALATRFDVLNRKTDRYHTEFVDGFHDHERRLQVIEAR